MNTRTEQAAVLLSKLKLIREYAGKLRPQDIEDRLSIMEEAIDFLLLKYVEEEDAKVDFMSGRNQNESH